MTIAHEIVSLELKRPSKSKDYTETHGAHLRN